MKTISAMTTFVTPSSSDALRRLPFYITTPIYYVNDRPHIGHAYTTTLCDVVARFQRFRGREVFFLTGTDEHGVKVEKSAEAAGIAPQALADRNAAEFERVLGMLGLTNDDFIRTTQPRHVMQVQALVQRLIDSGDVYLGEYEGWYDEGQEEFVTQTRAEEADFKSPISGKPLVRMVEKNYFFRLSNYQERLERLYAEHPGFVRPEARRNEMLGRLRDGLQDVPVSRTTFSWGIPIPGDEAHVMWVWMDALSNYVTAIGLAASDDAPEAARRKFWPADYHVVGKEILFFHAMFWPAMLMALEIPLPKCIYAHSFWISEGRKMSKSLGNFIDLEALQQMTDEFSLDALRWFMVTQGPLGATDADFRHAKFVEVYNADLANTFGNSVNRVTNMIGKYFEGRVPEPGSYTVEEFDWKSIAASTWHEVQQAYDAFDLSTAAAKAMDLVRQVDAFIDTTRPFTMAKDPARLADVGSVLYQCAETLRIASLLLWPVLPFKVELMWHRWGMGALNPNEGELEVLINWGGDAALQPGSELDKGEPLFPRWVDEDSPRK